jgi:hypothetical protein
MNPEAKILAGIAGEYFVAGELSRRGYIASITLRNTANIDLLASNGEKAVNVQVKTKRNEAADSWDLGNKPLKCEETDKNTFYIFVDIHSSQDNKEVAYYVIPKQNLNKAVEENFLKNKEIPKRNGQPKTSSRRRFRIKEYPEFLTAEHKDNFSLLFSQFD